MNTLLKWIGGSSVVALVLIGSAVFAGNSLEARDGEIASWLAADDVLAADVLAADDVLVSEAGAIALSIDDQLIASNSGSAQNAENMAAIEDENVAADTALADSALEPTFIAEPVVQETPAFDADNPFVIKSILPIEGPIRYGEWYWDDDASHEGPLVMTVDLEARVISVFRDGHEIGATAALLGTSDHPTPLGVFPILTKERDNISERYNNAPMPWTLRLTWDGIAIHGGSTVELGYASHGCIGVPDEFASRLFDIARIGDVVIITDGQRADVGTSLAS